LRLLLAEDDDRMRDVLERGLREHGYIVDSFASGADAELAIRAASYDLAVLDWMLPGRTGPQVCAALRRNGNALPVLMLTARDAAKDRVAGLDSGADDYLVKPFDFSELLARIRTLLRRPPTVVPLRLGNVLVDSSRRTALVGEKRLLLTAREYLVLERLARHPETLVRRLDLERSVLEDETEAMASNSLDVHISRIRRKLRDAGADVQIVNSRGVGFRLAHL
jgi:DNA-binding response OmpR family regulator